MNFLQQLKENKKLGIKQIALLLDPEKFNFFDFEYLSKKISEAPISYLLIGGSYEPSRSIDEIFLKLKSKLNLPLIIFPGHPSQISKHADAILFLSLISGRNPDYLIEHHINSVSILDKTKLEIIPTSYLLIGSNNNSNVEKISKTKPLDQFNVQLIVDTARAGLFLGQQITYLEAGSGAANPIPNNVIKAVSKNNSNPIFVGGGIKNMAHIQNFFDNGADVVVIGNSFEKNLNFFNS
jgi:phosphoglycerol geranylgeranyltransferase